MAGKLLIAEKADLILTLEGASRKQGRRIQEEDLGLLPKGSIVCRDGVIEWIGPHARLPKAYAKAKAKKIDLRGKTVLPGFVECHTHLVFAGDRAAEFEMKNNGVSYQEIAAAGGGILSTMKQTRAMSTANLASLAQSRADQFVRQGVTTLEVKSGYALNLKDEIRQLQAAGAIKGPRVIRTFLGAHALPPEFKTYESYLEHLQTEVLPEIARKKLAERVDVFIEKGFFPAEASRKYLQRARELGFAVTIHADQLSLCGGAETALTLKAHSADHLIQIGEKEISALAKSEVTAVLLPAADLYMKCAYPPARKLIEAGARVALATDFNPGTSPTQDLSLVGLLARLEMKMTLPEVISAYTLGAAWALGKSDSIGSLEVGKRADFSGSTRIWNQLFYSIGDGEMSLVVRDGSILRDGKTN